MKKTRYQLKVGERTKMVFQFIVKFKRQYQGRSPTYREIMDGTDLRSTSTVNYHVGRLVKLGKVEYDDKNASTRSLMVKGARWEFDDNERNAEDPPDRRTAEA